MSILIKGMDMPTRCCDCPVCGHDYQFCRLAEKDFDEFDCVKSRADWCPLVELQPHGSLIDADALTNVIEDITWYHQNKNKDMVEGANSDEEQAWHREQDIYAAIEDAPTIIERADPI